MDIVTIKTQASEASFVSGRTRGLCAEQKQFCPTPRLSAGQRRLVAKTEPSDLIKQLCLLNPDVKDALGTGGAK